MSQFTRSQFTRTDPTRIIKAPTGTTLTCKSWLTEAPYRMLQNNLHPDVAENPQSLYAIKTNQEISTCTRSQRL